MIAYMCEVGRQNPVIYASSSGVSKYAEKLRIESDEVKQSFARTISFGDRLSQILEALIEIRQEYSKDNWDGYGAKAVSKESFENALRVALSLPMGVPIPEVDVMPSGQVAFIWSEGKRRVFSVVIGNRDDLSYAGLFGVNKTHGSEYFGDDISNTILDNINRVYS